MCSGLKKKKKGLFFYAEPFISESFRYNPAGSQVLRENNKKKQKEKHPIHKTERCLPPLSCSHTSAWTAFPTDGLGKSDRSTSTELPRTSAESGEPRGSVAAKVAQCSAQDEFVSFDYMQSNYWTEVSGGACETFLQPGPVNQSVPIRSLVGFISTHSHLWLKPVELEAVSPTGRTHQGADSSWKVFFLFFFFGPVYGTAGCCGVGR